MIKSPSISIVMINFNGIDYLKETIPPLLCMNYPEYELIVADNGSADGSIGYISGIPKIRLIHSPRYREKNYACNYAISHASGKYILLLDNDVIITDRDILSKLVSMYESLPGIGALGLAVHDRGIDKSSRYGTYFGYYFIREVQKIPLNNVKSHHGLPVPATGGQIFIKKSLWREIGGYDDHLKFGGDDNDLGIRLSLFGYTNYLYADTNQVHIGIGERTANEKYTKKFRDTYYAHLYTIVKNYSTFNMIAAMMVYPLFTILKSLKQAVSRRNFGPIWAFFQGYRLFLINLPFALARRKEIQKNRIVKRDIFLSSPARPDYTNT